MWYTMKKKKKKKTKTLQQYNTISMIHSITECNTIQQIKQYNKEYNNSPELRMNEWMNEWNMSWQELRRQRCGIIWYVITWCDIVWYDIWYNMVQYDVVYMNKEQRIKNKGVNKTMQLQEIQSYNTNMILYTIAIAIATAIV